jgi:hypothetical protein
MTGMTDSAHSPYGSPPGGELTGSLEQAREHAIRVLSDGYAYDALTEDEFEWRLGQLSGTHSPAEVQALIADLPSPSAAATSLAYATTPAPVAERIRGLMSDIKRDGAWRVPQQLRVKATMSSVRLDLREAIIPPGCTIDVRAIMSSVTIIVPPGLAVDFDVTPIMASTSNDSARSAPAFGAQQIRVRGNAFMAEVQVRRRDPRY